MLRDYLEQLDTIKSDYEKKCELLTFEEIVLDQKLCLKIEREKLALEPIAIKYNNYLNLKNSLKEFQDLIPLSNQSEIAHIEREIGNLNGQLDILAKDIISTLKTYNGSVQDILIEINHTNEQSKKLVEDIHSGYLHFAEKNSLSVLEEPIKTGYRLTLNGINAKDYFEKETGQHSCIYADGSRASCNVFVFDAYKESQISFSDQDINIITFRSSGAGGQHINTTDSAIKATHLPTGLSITCQDERSQFQNKEKALSQLKEKVINHYQKQKTEFFDKQRRNQLKLIKSGIDTKLYDYQTSKIRTKEKITLQIEKFLLGEEL